MPVSRAKVALLLNQMRYGCTAEAEAHVTHGSKRWGLWEQGAGVGGTRNGTGGQEIGIGGVGFRGSGAAEQLHVSPGHC